MNKSLLLVFRLVDFYYRKSTQNRIFLYLIIFQKDKESENNTFLFTFKNNAFAVQKRCYYTKTAMLLRSKSIAISKCFVCC